VLFVCLGNSCRSPMAEAIARRNAADVIEASSAGLAPLGFVAEMTIKTLLRNGYPVEGLRSKPILPEAWEAADIIINMSGRARERAFQEYARVEDWDIEDPYGDNPDTYQRTCEAIQRRVAELAEKLRRTAATPSQRKTHREKSNR
jgi:protein-tyrosine-phosphatase